ncbi:TRAP transporter small permease [Aquibaculum sediminis]|uniref:TRAP transporter small permease n=1 Tax=Aquibaculum sediminis TaxID=3231907 RepID=UPI003453018F
MLLIARYFETFSRWIVIGAAVIMVVAAIAQVLFRYFFNYPLGWTEELARIMMVWWAFLAVGILASQRKLLSVDALLLILPSRGVHMLSGLANFLSGVMLVWLAKLGIDLVLLAGTQTSSALQIPYALIYLSLPVGTALAGASMIMNSLIDFDRFKRNEPANTSVISEDAA